jgi:transcriptional regulator of acetoin/glycerol metabolism
MQHLSGIDRARRALVSGHRFPAGALPVTVATSWERCRDYGLAPEAQMRDMVIPFTDVHQRRERDSVVRHLALAEMQILYSQIAGSNFVIAFADAEGVVLDTISDQHFADSRAGKAIIPGSIWTEVERGTNALGLAVLEASPVAIYGREHYFSCHSQLSCMAAPILNAEGKIAGLIDASCSSEARQQHTHALVKMAAATVENSLIYQERPDHFIFAFHPRPEYLNTLSSGLIAVSREGEISSINRPGQSLLVGLLAADGMHFETLFDGKFGSAMENLLSGGIIRIRDRAGSTVFMACRQIGARPHSSNLFRTPLSTEARNIAIVREQIDIGFVCQDATLRHAMVGLESATRLKMPVYLHGETGTGKELMAQHIHALSGRKGEFVALNCGAVPEALFISELFGHERGAFTDARQDGSPGLARLADGGSLFLDEVADIPMASQTALLRFLDSMEVRPVGGKKIHKVDVQILSASNRDLTDMVASRLFRADLLYRLNAYTLKLPTLKQRQDFVAIVKRLMDELAPQAAITDAAIELLRKADWPGNIRQLRSTLQRALTRRNMEFIDEESFDDIGISQGLVADVCDDCRGHPLNQHKCREIRSIYRSTGRNISEAARSLGLSRTTVYKHVS